MKTFFSALILLAVSILANSQELKHEYDSTLANQLGADERGMKTYVLVMLKTGSGRYTG